MRATWSRRSRPASRSPTATTAARPTPRRPDRHRPRRDRGQPERRHLRRHRPLALGQLLHDQRDAARPGAPLLRRYRRSQRRRAGAAAGDASPAPRPPRARLHARRGHRRRRFILLIGVLGVLTLLNTANANTHKTKVRDGARASAREVIGGRARGPLPRHLADQPCSRSCRPSRASTTSAAAPATRCSAAASTTRSPPRCAPSTAGRTATATTRGGTFCADSATIGTRRHRSRRLQALHRRRHEPARGGGPRDDPPGGGPQRSGQRVRALRDAMTCTPTSPVTSVGSITCSAIKTSLKATRCAGTSTTSSAARRHRPARTGRSPGIRAGRATAPR